MLKISHMTHRGKKRDHNEDAYLFNESLGVFIVCDGMGGHAAGEVASAMACESVMKFFNEHRSQLKKYRENLNGKNRQEVYDLLDQAIATANKAIYQKSQKEIEKKGMGTTLVMILKFPHGVFVSHVGDSRAYLMRKGKLKQLTQDHSLVNELLAAGMISKEEAYNHPQGNVITKALGIQSAVVGDSRYFETMEGDVLFMCSDGLHDYFKENEATSIYQKDDCENPAQELVHFALNSGGRDNITCVLLEFVDKDDSHLHPEKVTVDSKIEVLKKIPLFSSLNYKEISYFLEFTHVVDILESEVIIQEEELGDEMYVILKGELGVYYKNQEVNKLKEGQFFGEMALIDHSKRSATVKALTKAKLLKIIRGELFPVLKKEPRIGVKIFWAFLQNMNKRLRENDKIVANLYEELGKEGAEAPYEL